ncbi:serine/threonine-protein kinase [Tychonema sp. LEGE 07203]|uniref:serine/threonine-protein kinase n=1 Tax=Tychonema sp. LEGE 07203 TaxID=1828671 RepID=UPI0018812445|nr:serine/threonine-protein kinase [Tychonema sp. LEGE 07203]MBE9095025.1 protein kinase [Tychonema sp. LEGE 07203]
MIPELSAGTSIKNRYEIDRILGQGGFGRTYLALDRQNNHSCVLKEFAPSNTKPEALQKARELFEREAQILSTLNHRQIPEFLDWFEENGRLFIVQEFVNGTTYEVLRQSKSFSEKDIVEWLRELLEVLQYIHGKGIIHRDISPDNIMLPNGKPKPVLIDFGVVKYAETQLANGRGVAISNQPTQVGKVAYCPSEQLRGGECYPNSDLYALAVTAIVLLTGREPNTLMNGDLEWEWRSSSRATLTHVNVSDKLAAIIDKMLQEKPSDRYQSARDVLNALDNNSKTQGKTLMGQFNSDTEISSDPGQSTTEISTGSQYPDNRYPPASHQYPDNPYNPRKPDRDPNQWKTIALIALPILLLVGGVAALESPRIGFLCGALNNCAADKPFNESYSSAVKQAGDARVLGQNAQTAQELQTAGDRMKSAIDQLSSIPQTAKVYPDAQKLLPSYQSELTAMEARLTREQQAQKQLEEAMAIAADAPKATELSTQKDLWIEAADKLKAISSDSFVADKVKTLSAEYDRQIKDIEASITQPPSSEPPSPEPSSPEAKPTPDDLFRLSPDNREPSPAPEVSPSLPNAPTPKDDGPLF